MPKLTNAQLHTQVGRLQRSLKRERAKRQELERALKESGEQQTATSEILRVISSSPTDLTPVFATIVANATRLCEAQLGNLFSYDGDALHAVAHHNASPPFVDILRGPLHPGPETGLHQWLSDPRPFQIADMRLTRPYEESEPYAVVGADLEGIRTLLGVPLVKENRPVGVITIYRREVRPFTDNQIDLVKTFADQAVIAIENVRLFKELESRNRDLTTALDRQTATADVLRIIAQSPTELQPVLDAIATSAMRLCAASDAVIERLEGDRFYNAAHAGAQMKGLLGLPLPLTRQFPGGRAILDRQRVILDDIHLVAEQEYPDTLELLKRNTIHSVAEIPLLSEGEPLGSLAVLRAEVRPFTDPEVSLLQTFADQAVIAIENVRLFKELEARNQALTEAHAQVTEALEQQTATSEILRVISSSPTNIQPVLDAVAASAARVCGATDALIMRVEEQDMRRVAHFGPIPLVLPGLRRITSDSTAGRAILECRPIHVHDILDTDVARDYRETAAAYAGAGWRTTLTVPLVREDVAIGAIVIRRTEVRPFTDKQIELLETFADQAVIAIENVRLFKALEARNRALTEALDQQTATSEILRVISRSPTDVQPVFDTIVTSAGRLCGAESAVVYRFEGEMADAVALYNLNPGAIEAYHRRFPRPLRDTDHLWRVADGSVLNIADIADDPHTATNDSLRSRDVRSLVLVPMVREEQAIGAIGVSHHDVGAFSEERVRLLKTFAAQAVIAIENVRLFKELEARNRELTDALDRQTATSELLKVIGRSTFDLQPVFETLAENAVRLCQAEHAFIFGFDGQVLRSVATHNIPPALKAFVEANPVRPGRESGAARAAMERRTVHIEDIQAEPEYTYGVVQVGPMRTLLAIPMLRADELLGVIVITRPEVRLFTDGQIALMETFADQAAIAIENARLFREIESKNRQLEVASQHKSEFLANMSHELRTPLNAIIGFSEVLSERMFGELNEKQAEYLKDIYASGTHLLSLINDILDLSKIEAGRMELELTEFDLPTAIDSAVTLVRERAGRRGITLKATVDERLGEVRADERKIRQVVLNLLSNAIKFTPEGGRIEVRAAPKDEFIEVSVSDTGVGIAPEDQEAVFVEFRQVGTAEKKAEGTGLGLTLCRKFVELHDGKIWVTSRVGVGSTFTFTIPARRGELSTGSSKSP